MSTFKITVIRTDEYKIEVEESVWTPEVIKDWAKTFYPAQDTEDIAKYLAGAIMNMGSSQGFIEGFGYVRMFRPDSSLKEQFSGFKKIKEEEYSEGIKAIIIDENEEYEYEIKELTVS